MTPPSVTWTDPSCARTCTLEVCLTEGCWLRRVAVGDAVEAVVRRLAEEADRHHAACRDPRCRHFVHRRKAGDISEEQVA